MCGICGVVALEGGAPVDPERLIAMRDHMRRRGPDGAGLWLSIDGHAGLGHRRLAIIDLSGAGAQPMHDADGRFIVSFNGEIYNYLELRRGLEQLGARFRTYSDTEVILELYKRHGASAFARLYGMFALAIWDETERSLCLARDPFGIKPLYTYEEDGRFLFASQVKAILAHGDIDTTVDPAGHVGFFLWGHVPEPFTFYRRIAAFPAGHYRVIRDGQVQPAASFSTIKDVILEAQESPSPAPSREALRQALEETIRRHYVADVPVGIFLSAGKDSTTIAALSAHLGIVPHCFTLGFKEFSGGPQDELPTAKEAAATLGLRHTTCQVTKESFTRIFPQFLRDMDQPSTDGGNTYLVSKYAAKAGMKVVLSGLGGDELFGGYATFHQVPQLCRLVRNVPARTILGKALHALTSPWIAHVASPKFASLLSYGGIIAGAWFLRRGLYMPWELPRLLGADMAREGWERLRLFGDAEALVDGIRDERLAIMMLELTYYMRDQLLRDGDWASMAHSVELRTPIVDWRFFRSIAAMLSGLCKDDFVARELLPPSVLRRPKSGFGIPIQEWLLAGRTPPREPSIHRGMRHFARVVYTHFA